MLHWYSKSQIPFPAGYPNFCTRHQKSWATKFRYCGIFDKHLSRTPQFLNAINHLVNFKPGCPNGPSILRWAVHLCANHLVNFKPGCPNGRSILRWAVHLCANHLVNFKPGCPNGPSILGWAVHLCANHLVNFEPGCPNGLSILGWAVHLCANHLVNFKPGSRAVHPSLGGLSICVPIISWTSSQAAEQSIHPLGGLFPFRMN